MEILERHWCFPILRYKSKPEWPQCAQTALSGCIYDIAIAEMSDSSSLMRRQLLTTAKFVNQFGYGTAISIRASSWAIISGYEPAKPDAFAK